MTVQSSFEAELALLMVETLNLEVPADSIDPQQPLYQEGLGLDSIDLLELSVVISKTYGFQLKSDDPDITHIFSSLRALSDAVTTRRTT